MRYLIALSGVVAALLVPATASAGGWATVGFEPLPDGTLVGETWSPAILVKQHGVTPLEGLAPTITIEKVGSGDKRTFTAAATSAAGRYEAAVVFPSAGDWRVAVDSGFGDSGVTYGPVTIASPTAITDPGGGFPTRIAVAALLALVLAAAALAVVRRGWRPTPASR